MSSKHTHAGDVEDLFDQLGASYSDAYESNPSHVQSIEDLINVLSPGSTVLDVGCATGRPTSTMLSRAGMRVTGIDVSSKMLEAARNNVPDGTFIHVNATKYEPKIKYDAIVVILALLTLPTSTNRELAYKMSHWLKPGGYILFGAIDFTDIPKASGFPSDPTGEWLHHRLMDRTIKDNVFGVGDWISELRRAGIVLLTAHGATWDIKPGQFVAEPECFFLGKRNEASPLFGPFQHPYEHYGAEKDTGAWSLLTQRWKLQSGEAAPAAMGQLLSAAVVPAIWRLDDIQGSGSPEEVKRRVTCVIGEDTGAEIALVQAAPHNDVVYILNKAHELMGRPRQHHGTLLQTAAGLLEERKYARVELKLRDGYLDFTDTRTWTASAAAMMAAVWFGKDLEKRVAETIIRLELESYERSHRELNGHVGKIGFACVALLAKK